jgi:HEAT repeat protein
MRKHTRILVVALLVLSAHGSSVARANDANGLDLLNKALAASSEDYVKYRAQFVALPEAKAFTAEDLKTIERGKARVIATAWLHWREEPDKCGRLWRYQPPMVPTPGMSYANGKPVLRVSASAVQRTFSSLGRTGQLLALERVLIQKTTLGNGLTSVVLDAREPLFVEVILDHAYTDTRVFTIRWLALGEGHEVSVPLLVRELRKYDRNRPPTTATTKAAAEALGRIGPDAREALPALKQLTQDDRLVFVTSVACYKITGNGDPSVGALIPYLSSDKVPSRLEAAKSLSELGKDGKGAIPALIRALDDEIPLGAIIALGRMKEEASPAVPALIKLVEERGDEGTIGIEAVRTLAAIGPEAKASVPTLIKTLDRRHHNISWESAQALGAIGPPAKQAIPRLVRCLQREETRDHAAVALGRIGGDAIPALQKALGDSSWRVRRAAQRGIEVSKNTQIPNKPDTGDGK